MREEEDITDAFLTEQHHDQAVDSDADAAGRGHAVLEGGEEIVIQFLLLLTGLVDQRLALGDRIVLLGVGRGDFLPVDAAFEHLDGGRIFRRELGQRDQLLWQMSDEGWLDQRRLDQFLEQAVGDLEILVVRGDLRAEIDRALAAFVGQMSNQSSPHFSRINSLYFTRRTGGEVDGAGDVALGVLVLDHGVPTTFSATR